MTSWSSSRLLEQGDLKERKENQLVLSSSRLLWFLVDATDRPLEAGRQLRQKEQEKLQPRSGSRIIIQQKHQASMDPFSLITRLSLLQVVLKCQNQFFKHFGPLCTSYWLRSYFYHVLIQCAHLPTATFSRFRAILIRHCYWIPVRYQQKKKKNSNFVLDQKSTLHE